MLKEKLAKQLKGLEFTSPPKPEMGDLAVPCFVLAKEQKKNPAEAAKELAAEIKTKGLISQVEAVGPYVNLILNSQEIAKLVLSEVAKDKYGRGRQKGKIMVEFAHPNTHKAFHIGHLRNIITGESIVRILENAGCKIIRANYQGDVGMHIAKCLWGIEQSKNEYEEVKNKSLEDKAKFLGKVYALGGRAYEENEQAKKEILQYNEKIYSRDSSIKEVYETTREWSLEYFNHIYQRVYSKFDHLYFESQVFAEGKEIVMKFLETNVFKKSKGAIIFAGSKYGLHDRVFINSKGYPTYEGKDLALAKKQFSDYNPDKIIHVVGKEQSEYFKVVFKALEFTLPKSKGREFHLDYGWVTLKSGKMSSRTGQVVLGEWLLDEVEKKVKHIMKDSEVKNKADVIAKVGLAASKYAFLKTGVKNDIKFDLEESVSLSGDSGPYLLYIVARIRSILRKAGVDKIKYQIPDHIEAEEKQLLLKIADFSQMAELAAKELDPSKIAHYLFELAQAFNSFYDKCPVLTAEDKVKNFRLKLAKSVEQVMIKGLYLLGIETVEQM